MADLSQLSDEQLQVYRDLLARKVPGMEKLGGYAPAYPKPPELRTPVEQDPEYDPTFKKDYKFMAGPVSGIYGAVRGVERMAGPAKAIVTGAMFPQAGGIREADTREAAGAAHDILSGAMQAGIPFAAGSAAVAPIRTAVTLGAGLLGQTAVTEGLKYLDLPPEYANFVGDLAGLVTGAKALNVAERVRLKGLLEFRSKAMATGQAGPMVRDVVSILSPRIGKALDLADKFQEVQKGRAVAPEPAPFVGPTVEQAQAPVPTTPVEAAPTPVEAPPQPVVAPEPAPAPPVERWQPPTLEQRLEGLGPDTQRQILEKIGTPKAKELLAKLPPPGETPPAAPPTNLETLAETRPTAEAPPAAPAGQLEALARTGEPPTPPAAAPATPERGIVDPEILRKKREAGESIRLASRMARVEDAAKNIESANTPEEIQALSDKQLENQLRQAGYKQPTVSDETMAALKDRLKIVRSEPTASAITAAPTTAPTFTTVDDFVSRMRQSGGTAEPRKWSPSTWKALGVPPYAVGDVIQGLEGDALAELVQQQGGTSAQLRRFSPAQQKELGIKSPAEWKQVIQRLETLEKAPPVRQPASDSVISRKPKSD